MIRSHDCNKCKTKISYISIFKYLVLSSYLTFTIGFLQDCGPPAPAAWGLVMRLAPRLGGPLGLSNLGRSLAVFFGCSSSIRNASVSSEPESISSCKRERNGLVSMIVEVINRLKRTLVQTITERKIINASISI